MNMAIDPKTSKLPPVEQLRSRPIGRILTKMGLVSREQVHDCLKAQQGQAGGVKIGQVFIQKGLITEDQLQVALAAQRGMEFTSIDGLSISGSSMTREG
jgi:type IV pilus assembly protein PilB